MRPPSSLRGQAALAVGAHPLTRARLWHREPPQTSQRRAAQAVLGPGNLKGILLGGNRSGKTEEGAQIAVASAEGKQSLAVQIWARLNRLDISELPDGPGRVCCSSLTGNDSIRVQRKKVEKYLPPGTKWKNQQGHGEASAHLPGGGLLLFKSNDQGRRAFQGDNWDLFWADEEHDEAVVDEARMRLVDRSGRALFTMTPLKGQTWVWERFVDKPESGSVVYALHSADNPHIPREYMEALLSKYGSRQRAARSRGEFVALEGLVYPDWRRDIHVISPFDIPQSWDRYQAIDFGYTNPTAVLWGALDPDGRLFIYREHYRARWLIGQHAEAIMEAEACPRCWDADGFGPMEKAESWWEGAAERAEKCPACKGSDWPGRREPEPEVRWADPENVENRRTLHQDYDLHTQMAIKDVLPGIEAVAGRLVAQGDGRPRLYVFRSCPKLIREIGNYRWKQRTADGKPKPIKQDDHAVDALRYMVFGLQRLGV